MKNSELYPEQSSPIWSQSSQKRWDHMNDAQKRARFKHIRILYEKKWKILGGWSNGGVDDSRTSFYEWRKYKWQRWGILLYEGQEALIYHSHFLQVTQLLQNAWKNGNLHPIFEPVKMYECNSRPWLVRHIPWKVYHSLFWKNQVHYQFHHDFIDKFLSPFLFQQLKNIGFQNPSEKDFDITYSNILVNEQLENIFSNEKTLQELQEILYIQDPQKSQEKFLSLLTQWHNQWGRFYLFDYDTWFKPDWTDKYGEKMTVMKKIFTFAVSKILKIFPQSFFR